MKTETEIKKVIYKNDKEIRLLLNDNKKKDALTKKIDRDYVLMLRAEIDILKWVLSNKK